MSTPIKYSNPDTPACNYLRLYADCLITDPLKAIFYLPFPTVSTASYDWAPRASKPRDQWPAEWRPPETGNHARSLKKDMSDNQTGSPKVDDVEDKIGKNKLADGVLKIATFR
ncbi:hypothetical protein F5Y07DRAFT_399699 [Xylaria sp. FL0933]|nr:hypothetical protein F5Y07DRAFT_399699 [Xylaria sp. FL0933]